MIGSGQSPQKARYEYPVQFKAAVAPCVGITTFLPIGINVHGTMLTAVVFVLSAVAVLVVVALPALGDALAGGAAFKLL